MVRKGYVLRGFVLETLPEQDYVQCKNACTDHPRCKSIMEDKDTGTCELNEKSIEGLVDEDLLVPRAGWMFSSTDYDEINVSVQDIPKACVSFMCLLWRGFTFYCPIFGSTTKDRPQLRV